MINVTKFRPQSGLFLKKYLPTLNGYISTQSSRKLSLIGVILGISSSKEPYQTTVAGLAINN